MADISISLDRESGIATAQLCRPPHNFLDAFLLRDFCDGIEEMDADPDCRCILLSSQGRNFSAGRDFGGERREGDTSEAVYAQAVRLMAVGVPMIAIVQGAAVGAGMGLAMVADFRLCSERAYFSANFVAHGLHHGFGLTTTLPAAIGRSAATRMLLTGRKYGAEEACKIGLVSSVVEEAHLVDRATELAQSVASNPRAAVRSIRQTMREGLLEAFRSSVEHEGFRQAALREGAKT